MKAYRRTQNPKKTTNCNRCQRGQLHKIVHKKKGMYDPKYCVAKGKKTRETSTEKMATSSKEQCEKCELAGFGDEQREMFDSEISKVEYCRRRNCYYSP